MTRLSTRGFSLVEMAVTLVVIGLVLGFGIPAYQSMMGSQQLKGATENIAGQMRLMRENSIGTNTTQTMHFTYNYLNCDYHIHTNNIMGAQWSLPHGITYYWGAGTLSSYDTHSDGRVYYSGTSTPASGMVILQNRRGDRDTVSVLASGLVLTK